MKDFAEQLERIKAASSDPQALALVTLDILLDTHPPELRRAVEAAAIPHWFDAEIFYSLLDHDLRQNAARWYDAVIALPAIEPFPARSGHNVHEATRLALRRRLALETPEHFRELSGRAAATFRGMSAAVRAECVFHRLAHHPEQAERALQMLDLDLRGDPEDALALSRTLWEYAEDETWPPLVRGWALLMQTRIRLDYVTVQEALSFCERALECFRRGMSVLGEELASGSIADVLLLRGESGDAGRARDYLETSLNIAERLSATDPENVQAARDVTVSLERLGDFQVLHGDSDAALACFERSLDIAERLLRSRPGDQQAERDLSISLYKIGNLHLRQGDTDHALTKFLGSVEIDQRLYETNPQSVLAARDLAVSLVRLGDLFLRRGQPGDSEQALEHFTRAHEIWVRLYERSSQSAQAARDLVLSLQGLGDFLLGRSQPGDSEQALSHFERSLEIARRLYATNPQNTQIARDVAVSWSRVGHLHFERGQSGDIERAFECFENAQRIWERLYEINTQSMLAVSDLAAAHTHFSTYYLKQSDPERAFQHRAAALAILRSFSDAGFPLSQPMRELYDYLIATTTGAE